jgi:hypothetical protein
MRLVVSATLPPGPGGADAVLAALAHGRPGAGNGLASWPVRIAFDAELWLWDGRRADAWTFVSLPASEPEEIRDLAGGLSCGFNSERLRRP